MSPQIERSLPPYRQIADDIAARIKSGELAEGDPIPSARQIAAGWGVAIATATKVQADLRTRGLVAAVPGVGTVVSTLGSRHGAQERGAATRDRGLVYRPGEVATITSAEMTRASTEVAAALGIGAGDKVIRRVWVTKQDGKPVSSSVSWFAGDLANAVPELLQPERVKQGTFALVAERTGRHLASGREEVAASTAAPADAAALNVKAGAAVLRSRNWFLDDQGDVIEYGESVRRAEQWSAHSFTLSH